MFDRPIVVTANDFRFFARDQAEQLCVEADIMLESEPRDSGPAIAAGAALALKRDPNAVVLALAAKDLVTGLKRDSQGAQSEGDRTVVARRRKPPCGMSKGTAGPKSRRPQLCPTTPQLRQTIP